MHKKALLLGAVAISAAAGAAATSQNAVKKQVAAAAAPVAAPLRLAQYVAQPAPTPQRSVSPILSTSLARWNSLRQTDSLPFSSYASFLASHRGWPGEDSLRKTAERAIDPSTTPPSEVIAYFRMLPALTSAGHARHAFALLATGRVEEARAAARTAWTGGVLPRPDEDRLLGLFGSALTTQDHDKRMETLLANGDTQSAARTLALTSMGLRPLYEARLALQTRAADASAKVASLGSNYSGHAGLLMDRANWLRNSGQSLAARQLLAGRPALTTRPANPETWFETLLTQAKGAAGDNQWSTAYQIASRVDDAYPAGTDISRQSTGERDDYTSLVWLAGTTAFHRLNRPADAATMFQRYARGGQSLQVLTKGLYWAGRAALQAGQPAQANSYFEEASRYPELFYAQLALERLGRPVPPPAAAVTVPTQAERAAFQNNSMVQATRLLGQMGSWRDQSLFVRAMSENAESDRERVLASELARQIGRQDLNVWLARSARNSGSTFYVRSSYPEVPVSSSQYWSLAHGIMRQESSFDRAATSPVGARGMMQLMPPTAREVAGKLGLPYSLDRLTSDPSYNITLGTSYLSSLMNSWGGNAVLVAAAYNAGSGNVRKWIREYGDPRMPGTDVLRWIEDIPFSETRGYVQRVLENTVVYDMLRSSATGTPQRNRLSYYLGKPSRPG